MTDHPILFSVPMVRATLDGRKTQMRGVLKPQPQEDIGLWLAERGMKTAHWVPGDRLWVREAWQYYDWTEDGVPFIRYRSGNDAMLRECPEEWAERVEREWINLSDMGSMVGDGRARDRRWRPSIHMPRWASRITLAVEAVRVERLQDISEGDAIAEGVTRVRDCCHVIRGFDYDLAGLCHTSAITPFWKYWTHLHGPDAWDANPWVSVTTFRRVEA